MVKNRFLSPTAFATMLLVTIFAPVISNSAVQKLPSAFNALFRQMQAPAVEVNVASADVNFPGLQPDDADKLKAVIPTAAASITATLTEKCKDNNSLKPWIFSTLMNEASWRWPNRGLSVEYSRRSMNYSKLLSDEGCFNTPNAVVQAIDNLTNEILDNIPAYLNSSYFPTIMGSIADGIMALLFK